MLVGNGISVEFNYIPWLNYSMMSAGCASLTNCVVINTSQSDLYEVTIAIESDLLLPSSVILDSLAIDARVDLTASLAINADPSQLINYTESVAHKFTVTVSIGAEKVASEEFEIHLTSYDHWLGVGVRPELLASLVTPNLPAISSLIVAAAPALNRLTGSDAFDEYQSLDPNRARAQAAAIFEAIRQQGIVYVTPPASFERSGQRVRMPEKVLREKLGTCLDLSILFATCLEAIGLHPIIALKRGHCFVGAWLVNDMCSKPVSDDPTFLEKSMADGINEIVMFEATAITSATPISFEEAVDIARNHLRKEEEFECFIDVARSRVSGIKPIPQKIDGEIIENEGAQRDTAESEVRQLDRYDLTDYEAEGNSITKYQIWERKLLDFSLRNNLLNLKLGRRALPIISFSIDALEDYLHDGHKFNVLPYPMSPIPQPNADGMFDSSAISKIEKHVVESIGQKKIYSFRSETDLQASLKYMYRASRVSLEENGASNLYMALGVLKWYESERSTQARYAPLLLLPIDILRRGGFGGYDIRSREEDIVLNITLVELMKQQGIDMSMLTTLPKDKHGADVKKIFAFVRDKIRSKARWNVLDEALIGLFSFNKFVMWNDIHSHAEKMGKNPIIASLVEGRLKIDGGALQQVDARTSDATALPSDFAIPLDVDSSQLEAVMASSKGQSFILHGPPGTGKSQTITNIIANALYQGKRVLFVAEKMAALSVVQSRLQKIGLAPFCLEMHSNKATKQHFLKQMDETLSIGKRKMNADYAKEAATLFDKRKTLNHYIESLHAKSAYGFSLYDCINRYLAIDAEPMDVDLSDFSDLNPEMLNELITKLEDLDTIFAAIGHPSKSDLQGLDIIDGSKEGIDTIAREIKALTTKIKDWNSLKEDFTAKTDLKLTDEEKWLGVIDTLREASESLECPAANYLRHVFDYATVADASAALDKAEELIRLKQQITDAYTEQALMINPDSLRDDWQRVQEKWFMPRWFAKRSMLKRMQAYSPAFCEDDIYTLTSQLQHMRAIDAEIQALRVSVINLLGSNPPRDTETLDKMRSALAQANKIRASISGFASIENKSAAEAAETAAHIIDTTSPVALTALVANGQSLHKSLSAFTSAASTEFDYENLRDTLAVKLEKWSASDADIRNWYIWCRTDRELRAIGLGKAVDIVIASGITGNEAAKEFTRGVYREIARRIIDGDESLRLFNGVIFDREILKYRTYTYRFQQICIEELFCKLASNVPSASMLAHESSEISILKRSIKNGGRGTSIRKIIDQIPTLLPRLCPCMLMSPLSVAQYLDIDKEQFDIVIFDEASQMPTSEAAGTIARGKSLIVVGDPKQMPPTSFFTNSQVGEEEAYIDDMESVLDDCISLSMPSLYLSWHYRSKHESLIAFSNYNYYDGRLTTFPSVDDLKSKVTLRKVNGVYDKGRTRSNKDEAREIVAEVIRRLSDEQESKLSIGIVSFSKVQQDLIEDMLNEALANDPKLEEKAYHSEEPIFIKNLENVQGDERDVILFSVGYGPDKNGKVSMNFGPLNNTGGERRLNVAVSRARYEMIVFSSISASQIDLWRTNAVGVIGLKNFLEYAEKGSINIKSNQAAASYDNGIINDIAAELGKHGYQTKLNIGRSQFKVDIAVINPSNHDEFLMGILCDGQSYVATKTARDREIVQPSVLKMLNWEVYKVWSVDWFEHKSDVLQRLLDKLKALADKHAAAKSTQTADVKPALDVEPALIEKNFLANLSVEIEDKPEELEKGEPYVFTPQISYISHIKTTESLISRPNTIKKAIAEIVAIEGPVTASTICKRIAAHSVHRVSAKLLTAVETGLQTAKVYTAQNGGANDYVYWPNEEAIEKFTTFRIDSDRDITEIPVCEIANAMACVARYHMTLDSEALQQFTAHQFGYSKRGTVIKSHIQLALEYLERQGKISVKDGRATYMG